MKTLTKLFALLIILSASGLTLHAQQKDYSGEPGYINFGDLTAFQTGEQVTEVILEDEMLKAVAGFSQEDPELKNLIDGLKLVKVNSFEITQINEKKIQSKIKSIDSELTNKKWSRIVKSTGSNQTANVYIKTNSSGEIIGLVATSLNKNHCAFVNIVGKIDLAAISKLEKFGMPNFNGMKHSRKGDGAKKETN